MNVHAVPPATLHPASSDVAPAVAGLFQEAGLSVRFRAQDPAAWDAVFARLPYRPVAYMGANLTYQHAYQEGRGGDWADLSCVIAWDRKPVAVWPLTVSSLAGESMLSSQGAPVLPPLFAADCPASTRKNLTKACLGVAGLVARALGRATWTSQPAFIPQAGCGDWHLAAMEQRASATLRHELFVDLALSLPDIKARFRKSFRSLVTSGERLWQVDLVHGPGNLAAWTEFRELHAVVAGRVTRGPRTWELQHEMLAADAGFLVTLRDENARLVGAGYYMCTPDEGLYAVAAYDRSLFDKPLGHVVQGRAIQELKRRGCRWYKIGVRSYPADLPEPSPKELAIASFKQGFASHVFPSLLLAHPCGTDGQGPA